MNKIVLITGATSGLGEKIKEYFVKQKDIVLNISRNCDNSKGNYCCDVSNLNQLKLAFDDIKNKYNKIDLLINCAGYGIAGATELIPEEDSKHIFDVNFFGSVYTCQLGLPLMTKTSKIINISSACALFPLPFRSFYCASKSALSMLSECLQIELKSYGIEVCNICPGDIKTNFSKNRVKITYTNEKYENAIDKTISKINQQESKKMDINYAVNCIIKIINKKHYKPLYIIGKKYKLLYFLSKIFPKRIINYFIWKYF